jgi:uncharacterized protein (DUF2249 family)
MSDHYEEYLRERIERLVEDLRIANEEIGALRWKLEHERSKRSRAEPAKCRSERGMR